MRAAVVALLGIALLAALSWRSDVPPPAPSAVTDAASAPEHAAEAIAGAPTPTATPTPSFARVLFPSAGVASAVATTVTVRGRVCWSDGTPAGGVKVRHAYDKNDVHARALCNDATTDADGAFALDLPLGIALAVDAVRGECVAPAVQVAASADAREVRLFLPCVPAVRGRLEDPSGRGVRGEVWQWDDASAASVKVDARVRSAMPPEPRWQRAGPLPTSASGSSSFPAAARAAFCDQTRARSENKTPRADAPRTSRAARHSRLSIPVAIAWSSQRARRPRRPRP